MRTVVKGSNPEAKYVVIMFSRLRTRFSVVLFIFARTRLSFVAIPKHARFSLALPGEIPFCSRSANAAPHNHSSPSNLPINNFDCADNTIPPSRKTYPSHELVSGGLLVQSRELVRELLDFLIELLLPSLGRILFLLSLPEKAGLDPLEWSVEQANPNVYR